MRIRELGKLITQCWAAAEKALRKNVRERYPDRDEEIITTLFHAELEAEVKRVSDNGAVSRAFLSDLKRRFWAVGDDQVLSGIARDLIATVTFHSRTVERKTGGDMGIVIVRPDVRMARTGTDLTIQRDHKRGLLCQAKIFGRSSRWRNLNKNQRKVLGPKLGYLALLLYRYVDQGGERRELAPFDWQLARDARTIEEVSRWLKSGRFPELQKSEQLFGALLQDQIGTADRNLIARDIAPPSLRRSLVIEIRWKDGKGPGNTVHLRESPAVRLAQHAVVAR